MKTFILMAHYGDNLNITKKCIDSLIKFDNSFDGIIVANNNTYSLKIADISNDKRVRVVNNGRNLGYGGGINSTIPLALSEGATHLFFINNDCYIDKPFLISLLKFAQKKSDAGVIALALKYKKNDKWVFDIGGKIGKNGKPYHEESSALTGKPRIIDFAGCVLIKKEVIEKIKGFDEHFFLYMEDVDFSLRVLKAKFKTYIVPSVYMYHALSKTAGIDSPRSLYHQTRSGVIYIKKYKKISYLHIFVISSLKRSFQNPIKAIFVFKGIIDGIFNRLNPNMVS